MENIFRTGTAGKKLPFHIREQFDIPSVIMPFYISKIAFKNLPLTTPNIVHVHIGVDIGTILTGDAELYIDGTYYQVFPGDFCLIDAKIPHMTGSVSDQTVEVINVTINTSHILSLPPLELGQELLSFFYISSPIISPVIKEQPQVANLLVEAYSFFCDKNPYGKMAAWGKVVEALAEIAGKILYYVEKKESLTEKASRKLIASATGFIHANFREHITLDQIARACNKSPSSLSHVFCSSLGCSPIYYRNKIRIDIALEQILSTDKKIETIALDCGFETLSNFYSIFSKVTGHTPSFFRKTA